MDREAQEFDGGAVDVEFLVIESHVPIRRRRSWDCAKSHATYPFAYPFTYPFAYPFTYPYSFPCTYPYSFPCTCTCS